MKLVKKDFFTLLLSSPHTIRPGLGKFIEAFKYLQEEEFEDFKETIREAKAEFNKVIERQKALNEYYNIKTK